VLDFRILGPLEVSDAGLPVELPGQRQRALLSALLVRANQVVPTERLIDDLWGAVPPRTARTSLHNAAGELRRALGTALVTRAPGYVLEIDPEQVDAIRFERALAAARAAEPAERAQILREALDLWRGPALADVAYESFAEHEAARLEELKLVGKEELIDAEIELGRHDAVIGELEALVRQNPLRERLRGQQLLALYRAGRQAEALAAYQDARRALLDELGIEPGPALQQLHQSILRQDTRLAPEPTARADHDHLDEVIRALLAARLVPVLGPGGAHSGRPPDARWERDVSPFAPADEEVAEHLARYFSLPVEGGLARISQLVAVTQGAGALHDELHTLLDRDFVPGPAHVLLASLPPLLRARSLPHQLIVTTLLDPTLEVAFEAAGEELDVVSYISSGRDRGKFLHVPHGGQARVVEDPNADAEISLDRRTVLLKVHGRVDRGSSREWESFVVSEDDYISYLVNAEMGAVIPVTLAARLRRSHFLFLGYTPRDWNLRVFLHRLWGSERLNYRSWAVQPAPDELVRELWRQRDVHPVDAAIDDYVEALALRLREQT
jgi:DNA-binding SARP family transcriptional activator